MEGNKSRSGRQKLSLGYGRGEVDLDLSRRANVEVYLPRRAAGAETIEGLLRESLESPVGSAALGDLASGVKSVTVGIPDKTRPPVARDMLPFLIEELTAAGVPTSGISVFISCGIHARHSDDDIRLLVGDDIFEALEIRQNDGYAAGDFENLGTTSRGTPVEVNRAVTGSDLIILIGGLAFHYFAGFTGGRKMLIPGAASVNTVKCNHRLTITESGDMSPGCRSGVLEGNPVHEDMLEAAGLLSGEVYLINVLHDGWGAPVEVISGDLVESHLEGTKAVRELFECSIDEQCDVAIASAGGHPLDVNMIQSHKSLEHASTSVRDGGVLIGVLACGEGIGSDTFLPWFTYGSSREVARNLYEDYELNGHTALSFIEKRERLRMILVSELGKDLVEDLGVLYAGDVNEAMAMADEIVGGDARVYVFPRAWGLLPVVKS